MVPELYSYFHIQLHHHHTTIVDSFPCSDHVVDEIGDSYYGYIMDFVLLLTGQFSKTVGDTETFLLYLEEHLLPLHERPSPCHRHRWSPQTNIGIKRRTFQSFYLCSHVMSPNTNPGIDQHSITTGIISLCHLL